MAEVLPRARLAAWTAVLFVSVAALLSRVGPAGAQSTVSFRGAAAAEGVRTGVVAEGGPVTNQVVDGASPIAQASIDTTSGSAALGSVAYPGDLVVTAPGLVAGFSGGRTSGVIPEYPLIAAAGSTTTPESRAEAPGSAMHAVVDVRHAEASATSGSTGSDADGATTISATASVTAGDDDVVTATAASGVTSVRIGPVVLGDVSAGAVVTRAPGADITREASFEVTGITIAGVEVRLTDEGLVVAGTRTPIDRSPLQPVLDGAGITMRSIEQQETTDGIVSAGIVVTKSQDLPAAITPATVTYTFGRAAASVSSVALRDVAPATSVPAGSGTAPQPVAATAAGVPDDVTAAPTAPAPPTLAASPAAPDVPATELAATPAPLFDLTTFYLVLVLAAACAGVTLELLRHLGVRLQWT